MEELMFKRKEEPVIEFVSKFPFLKDIEGVAPVPAKKFIPEWWFNTPFSLPSDEKHYQESQIVRQCPAFPELFHSGYVLPMWADTTLYFNSKTGEWRTRCGANPSPFSINFFAPHQFTDHASYTLQSVKPTAIFQFENPWNITATKGYSVYQFPLFYHFTGDFSVLPGVFEPNSWYSDKLEVAYFGDDKEIFIKRGTPLVHYIPYKKEKIGLVVRDQTESDVKRYNKMLLERATTFKSVYSKNRSKG
jgi:hypothetical protein